MSSCLINSFKITKKVLTAKSKSTKVHLNSYSKAYRLKNKKVLVRNKLKSKRNKDYYSSSSSSSSSYSSSSSSSYSSGGSASMGAGFSYGGGFSYGASSSSSYSASQSQVFQAKTEQKFESKSEYSYQQKSHSSQSGKPPKKIPVGVLAYSKNHSPYTIVLLHPRSAFGFSEMEVGDVILSVNGVKTTDGASFEEGIKDRKPVTVVYSRDGQQRQTQVSWDPNQQPRV
jgi:hypothetical protein